MFEYRAYGLNIQSELELREFAEVSGVACDVSIKFGKIAERHGSSTKPRLNWQGEPGSFQLKIPGVGRFLICDGEQITIERYQEATDNQLVVSITGSVFAALLQQRNHMTLHGSCVKGPHGAILFLGASATGKSTLLTAMVQRKYQMMAENISALTVTPEGEIQIVPGAPTVKIWKDSADILNFDLTSAWKIRNELDAYNVPVDAFHSQPLNVSKIFILDHADQDKCTIDPVESAEGHLALRRLTYRKHFFGSMKANAFHFSFLKCLVTNIPLFKLTRPTSKFAPELLAHKVDSSINPSGNF